MGPAWLMGGNNGKVDANEEKHLICSSCSYLASVVNEAIGTWNTVRVTTMQFVVHMASVFNQVSST